MDILSQMPLSILYQDEWLVAVNKPCGYLVHKSPIARDAEHIVLQILRDQIGKKVFPIHRLDRKTSGVLLFALDKETNSKVGKAFANREVDKEYTAIVRGWIDDSGIVDYALINDSGKTQEAVTRYQIIDRFEIDLAHGKFLTSRYAHVQLTPETGRMHQLRKHMNHLRHPILGDRPHGCSKQNRLWKNTYNLTQMMLHAQSLSFVHPHLGNHVTLHAPYHNEYKRVMQILETS